MRFAILRLRDTHGYTSSAAKPARMAVHAAIPAAETVHTAGSWNSARNGGGRIARD